MSADWTTTIRPACSEKIEMNNSGRLPRADWRMPVAAGDRRAPIWSVPSPTKAASIARATAVVPKMMVGEAPDMTRTALTIVVPTARR